METIQLSQLGFVEAACVPTVQELLNYTRFVHLHCESAANISMIPQNWSTEAGREYTVSISGIGAAIEYTVSPVACQ